MKSHLWSIPAIAVYFYVATVLTGYGFASYFNIPSNFISASLSDNIIYFFQLLTASKYAAGQIGLLMWIVVAIVAFAVFALYHFNRFFKTVLGSAATVLFFSALLWGSHGLGGFIAKTTSTFWIPSTDCGSIGTSNRYIIPVMSDTQAVLVPIDDKNKMTGGFLVKSFADLNCKLEYKNIGAVTQ